MQTDQNYHHDYHDYYVSIVPNYKIIDGRIQDFKLEKFLLNQGWFLVGYWATLPFVDVWVVQK